MARPKGIQHTEEQKERMSESATARWAARREGELEMLLASVTDGRLAHAIVAELQDAQKRMKGDKDPTPFQSRLISRLAMTLTRHR